MSLKRAFIAAAIVGALPAIAFGQSNAGQPCPPSDACLVGDISSNNLAFAPEPETFVLLATGLVGIVAARRWRNKK